MEGEAREIITGKGDKMNKGGKGWVGVGREEKRN